MSKTIAELERTPRRKLIEEHDNLAQHTVVGVSYYLDELRRREAASREATMVKLTWVIATLTFVVTVATVINLAVFIFGG